jgi:flagellar biosynthesis protein FlhF
MELQRILAKDTREAMAKVHALYGDDALVISNKKARKQTEVIVAIDMAIDMAIDANTMITSLSPAKSRISIPTNIDELSFNQVIESQIFRSSPTLDSKSNVRVPAKISVADVKNTNDDNSLSVEDRDYLKARELVDLVKNELGAMRRELRISQELEANKAVSQVPAELSLLITSLDAAGIPAALRILVSNMIAKESKVDSATKLISKSLGSAIKHNPVLEAMEGIHVIAGRSGSENTLMAMRIAKQKALDYGGRNIAIISYSPKQTKSWTQTQMLGLQLGVETYHASNPSALSHVVAGLEEPKLILIETAGINLEHQINEICTSLPKAKKHLLLPADASEISVNKYLKRIRIEWSSVMLTQLESDIHPWPIINALMATGNAISIAACDSSLNDEAFAIDGVQLTQHSLSNLPLSPD